MKVLVYSDYGCGCPDAIKQFNAKGFPENRYGEVVDFIENNCKILKGDFTDLRQICEANKNVLYHLEYSDNINNFETYLGWDSETHCVVCVRVVPIDLDKKYVIEEYDGAEELVEVPTYKCIDKTINLFERIK